MIERVFPHRRLLVPYTDLLRWTSKSLTSDTKRAIVRPGKKYWYDPWKNYNRCPGIGKLCGSKVRAPFDPFAQKLYRHLLWVLGVNMETSNATPLASSSILVDCGTCYSIFCGEAWLRCVLQRAVVPHWHNPHRQGFNYPSCFRIYCSPINL